METKIEIVPLKRQTAAEAENSKFHFFGACADLDLLDVLQGRAQGTAEQEMQLGRMARRWIKGDDMVTQSVRIKFGNGGKGSEMIGYIDKYYLQPVVNESVDPEWELSQYSWTDAFNGDGIKVKNKMDELMAIISKQPRGGTDEYWIRLVMRKTPSELATEFDRHMREQTVYEQQDAASEMECFVMHLSKAMWRLRQRQHEENGNVTPSSDVPRVFSHRSDTKKCNGKFCPATKYDDARCDVHDKPTYGRLRNLRDNYPDYVKEVNEARKKVGNKELDFSDVWAKKDVEMKVNSHCVAAADRALGFDAHTDDEEATIDDVLEQMSARWSSPLQCCMSE